MTYTVTIQPSGHQFTLETDETVLDSALRQGYAMPYGCRGGACGACKAKVISGEVNYPDGDPLAISETEKTTGMALFCVAHASSDLEIEVREIGAAKDIVIKTLPCRVASMEKLASDVMVLKLKLPQADRLQFLAGQYIDILLKDGRRRSFSIANAPHDDAFIELHVRKIENGEFTGRVFEQMTEKDLLRFEGPHGSFFWREESDRPAILMAGGTGFAPIKGVVEHVLAEGLKQPVHIYWGARNKESLYMAELAQSWADSHEKLHFIPVLSEPLDSDQWAGRTGFVHDAVCQDFSDLSAYDIYACGPPVMIQAGRSAFASQGMDESHFYFDSFDYAKDSAG